MKKRQKSKKSAPFTVSKSTILYAPFWSRAFAFITDIFMIGLPISLLMMLLFGYDQMHTAGGMDVLMQNKEALKNPPNPISSLLHISLFMGITIVLWHKTGQTPGKKMARIKVVDSKTLQNAPYWKLSLRFIGYLLSLIVAIGFFVGLFRRDKRTLHDLLSGTAVIRVA